MIPEIQKIVEEECLRCEHIGYYHRLDDASNKSPVDPDAKFHCIYPAPDVWPPTCDCPDMVRKPR